MNGQVPTAELRIKIRNGILTVVATIGVALATGGPQGWVAWVIYVVCVLTLAMISVGLTDPLLKILKGLPYRKYLAVLTVMVSAGALTPPIVWLVDTLADWIDPCPPPTQVRVLTTPDLLVPYRNLATEFENHAAMEDGACRPAGVHVYAMRVAEAMDGLSSGWSPEYLRKGPTPDIWLPESGAHVAEVRKRREASGFGPEMAVVPSVAFTPIVLGLPARTGIRLEDEQWQGQPWAALVRQLRDNRIGLVRPEPKLSTVGDFATVAIYTSDGGGAGLRQNPDPARAFETLVTTSIASAGYPSGAEPTALLRKQRQLGENGAAMVISELDLVRHNEAIRGPNGRGCDVQGAPPGCLRAIYPADTHRLDLPLAVLTWPEVSQSDKQREAVAAFRAWLESKTGHAAMVAERLRPPPGTRVQAPLSELNGVLPGGPQVRIKSTLAAPPEAVREEMLQIQNIVRKTTKVVISVDASGSMRERVGHDTRFALAARAVQGVHDELAKRTAVSLNVFSATMGVRPVDLASLAQVRPAGNTPQHRALLEGMQAAGPGGVLVLLTDGNNNVNDVSPQQLAELTGTRVLVLAFGEANCGTQVLIDVTNRTGGGCRQASVDTLPTDLTELLRVV